MTVQLSWLTVDSVTIPSGGDFRGASFDILVLDGTVTEQYDQELVVTEHPIEDGAPISDNARPGLKNVQLEVLVGAHSSSATWQDARQTTVEPEDRPGFVRDTLDRLRREAVEVELETAVGLWENMVITSVSESRDSDSGTSFRATVTLKEIRRVSTLEVEAPSPRVERARRPTTQGSQGTGTEASADNRSHAAALTDGVERLGRVAQSYFQGPPPS